MTRSQRFLCHAAIPLLLGSWVAAQTNLPKEHFNAVAIRSDEFASGAGRVLIDVTRWSTERESEALVAALRKAGPAGMLDLLRKQRSVGTIRTPDTLAYDLRFAQQAKGEDGGRDIVLATDRPIGFWESWHQPFTVDYPFTVVQMHIGPDGKGKGTLSLAAKVIARGSRLELENFSTSPVMLTEVRSGRHED